ncbi:hypothetical protein BG842_12905 [Haladaptatus sp. W1]|nr:hypothetical protein BG842_24195 [Haladaptatus sp. W1]ODR79901.1 hypothetical protein BG842_12905 [Haladaptatus sp. W1]
MFQYLNSIDHLSKYGQKRCRTRETDDEGGEGFIVRKTPSETACRRDVQYLRDVRFLLVRTMATVY